MMNLLRILGAYALLLLTLILACNLVLGIFAGDEAKQTLAVMAVLATGLVAALVVFALQRSRSRRDIETIEQSLPASQRAQVRANAAVVACAAGSMLTWLALGSLVQRATDIEAVARHMQWLAGLSAIVATLAIVALCKQFVQLRISQWLFRVALVLLFALIGIALVPDIVLRGMSPDLLPAPPAKGAQARDAWILAPVITAAVCWIRHRLLRRHDSVS